MVIGNIEIGNISTMATLTMIKIIQGDITTLAVDAIVNAVVVSTYLGLRETFEILAINLLSK